MSDKARKYVRGMLDNNGNLTPSVEIPSRIVNTLYNYAGLKAFRAKHPEPGELSDALTAIAIVANWESSPNGTKPAEQTEPQTESKQLTTQQAATKAQITPRAIRKAITEGRLPAEQIGNTWHINPHDLKTFMNSKTRN